MNELEQQFHTSMIHVLLCVADDKLFLGHRNSDWTGIAPILEADIAFSSLAQDDIAHASAFYELLSSITGQDPNQIAFSRSEEEYRCADIVTKSDQFNWAAAIARQFYCNMYDYLRLKRLSNSTWTPLSNLSKRIFAEQAIHVDHIITWIEHLGNGTEDAKTRIQNALDEFAPAASMMFESPAGIDTLFKGGIFIDEGCMFTDWNERVTEIAQKAGLTITVKPCSGVGGRNGKHDDDFSRSLAELQEVFSSDPMAAW